MCVIAFQKAKESVNNFLSWRLLSFEFTCRHNIFEVSYLQKNIPLANFVKKTTFNAVKNAVESCFFTKSPRGTFLENKKLQKWYDTSVFKT